MMERVIAAAVEGHTMSMRLKSRGYRFTDNALCSCGWGSVRGKISDGKGGTKIELLSGLRDRANAHLYEAWLEGRQTRMEL